VAFPENAIAVTDLVLHCGNSERIHLGALFCGGHGQQASPRERGRYMQHRSGAGRTGRIGACSGAVCSIPVITLSALEVEA
jgi:hypothetical protein